MSSAAISVRHKWITLMVQYLISAEIHDTGVCEVVKKTRASGIHHSNFFITQT